MNRIYKTVWNAALEAHVAVSEHDRTPSGRGSAQSTVAAIREIVSGVAIARLVISYAVLLLFSSAPHAAQVAHATPGEPLINAHLSLACAAAGDQWTGPILG